MKILTVHETFPGQPRELLRVLGANPENDVRALHRAYVEAEIPGVKKVQYSAKSNVLTPDQPLHMFQQQVQSGYGVIRAGEKLKKEGFIPDVIFGHSGWGGTLFLKDVFNDTPLGINLEWYYRPRKEDSKYKYRYMPDNNNSFSSAHTRLMNCIWLQDFTAADGCVTATNFQKAQFPEYMQSNIDVIHEGVNTSFFKPAAREKLVLPSVGLDLSGQREVVTYVSRGLEEIRGFPEFMEAVYHLQKMRPNAHVVIAGQDKIFYGGMGSLPIGSTWKSLMLEKFKFDESRLHFIGKVNLEEYRTLLRCSSVHVHLSWPFVTSWSLLEAMSCEALVVGSNTGGVQEMIQDGENGILVDLTETEKQAELLAEILSKPRNHYSSLRKKARETILEKYRLEDCMRRKLTWLSELMAKKRT
jgi:glycosyltransferase involved in cell wall biosynthesis